MAADVPSRAHYTAQCAHRHCRDSSSAARLATLQKHGYKCSLGSVYPFDPQIQWWQFATSYVLRNVRPGAVIALHDHGGRGMRTIAALAMILPELGRRGLQVVTLSELAGSS